METIVSITAVNPTLVRTVEHVNLIQLIYEGTPADAVTATMVTNVSIIIAIPILVRIVERVNSTREGTHAAVAPPIVENGANCITTAIPILANTMDGVQLIQIAH